MAVTEFIFLGGYPICKVGGPKLFNLKLRSVDKSTEIVAVFDHSSVTMLVLLNNTLAQQGQSPVLFRRF